MKQYQLKIKGAVLRQIAALPGNYRQRVQHLLATLVSNPRPANAKELRNAKDRYRIRLDQYRVVYAIEDEYLVIEVLKVGKKVGPEFYEDLDE